MGSKGDMNYRKVVAVLLLAFFIGACTAPEESLEESPTVTIGQAPATGIDAITEPILPNAATLRAEEAAGPTETPTLTPTPTPDPNPKVHTPCEEIRQQIQPNTLNELVVTLISGRDVWSWSGDNCTPRKLTDLGNVIRHRLIENKQTIIFEKFFPYEGYDYAGIVEVWAMNVDGSNQRILLDTEDMEKFFNERISDFSDPYNIIGMRLDQVVWIPNTSIIAFSTKMVAASFSPDSSNDLRLLDFNTGYVTTILGAKEAGHLRISPDGQKILITKPESISVYDLKSHDYLQNVFTYEAVLCYCEGRWYAKPRWSPDSQSFRVGIPPRERIEPDAEITVWEIEVSSQKTTELGSYAGSDALHFTEDFSPNLDYFIFYENNMFHIYDLGLGDNVEPIVTVDGTFEGWNSNSKSFLYEKEDTLFLEIIGESPKRIFSPPDNAHHRSAYWIDQQYFFFRYEFFDGNNWTHNIFLGAKDLPPIPLISYPSLRNQ